MWDTGVPTSVQWETSVPTSATVGWTANLKEDVHASQAPWTLVLNIPEDVEIERAIGAELLDVTTVTASFRITDVSLDANQKNTANLGFYANASSMVR